MKKVAVIGAGIAGVTTAYYLAKQGYDVTVYEQEKYPAMRTSYANGGQVSVSNSEVWNTWSNVNKGFKWMFSKDAPLLINPSFDWDKYTWLVKFLYNTATNQYEKNTAETIRMGLAARFEYEKIIYSENLKFDQSYSGILHFYKNDTYFDSAKKAKSIYNSNGVEWDILGPLQVKSLDPALKDIKHIVGGAWTPSDWTGDIHKFCIELSKVLKDKYNVAFMNNWSIKTWEDVSYYDKVFVCAGVGSVAFAKSIGDTLPIYPVKGYSITIPAADIKSLEAMPKISLLDDQAKIVTSTLGTRFRVAGTAELAGENYDIRKERIEPLLNWVHTNFPDINTHEYSSWACLRPMTPNMLPIVKRSMKRTNVYYNTGHGHLGWTLAPHTAKIITEMN